MLIFDDDIIAATQVSEKELKTEISIFLYSKGMLSFGQARKLAAIELLEFEELLQKRNIPSLYTLEDLETDIATLDNLTRQ